jgi:uncharacterized protein YciI
LKQNETTNEGEKIMKKRLSIFVAALILVAAASLAFASLGRRPQQQQKQFALLMKATGPEFARKVEEPEGQRLVTEHFKKLQTLTERGVCIFSGHTTNAGDSGFGIIVVRAESEAAAQKIIDDDDLVKAGLIRGAVFPFQVVTSGK